LTRSRNKCPHFDRISTCFIAGGGELTRVEALLNWRAPGFVREGLLPVRSDLCSSRFNSCVVRVMTNDIPRRHEPALQLSPARAN
jgi:hypothetical protein